MTVLFFRRLTGVHRERCTPHRVCVHAPQQSPHVKVGGRYRLGMGQIEVTALREIVFAGYVDTLR